MFNINAFDSGKIHNQRIPDKYAEKRLGQAYVPPQLFEDLLSQQQALNSGTVFAQLETPFAKNHYNRK